MQGVGAGVDVRAGSAGQPGLVPAYPARGVAGPTPQPGSINLAVQRLHDLPLSCFHGDTPVITDAAMSGQAAISMDSRAFTGGSSRRKSWRAMARLRHRLVCRVLLPCVVRRAM